MLAFALDTSCMIAAVCGWHEHHRAAAAEVGRRLDHGDAMVIPATALIEAYAVLTRLPAPHRLSAADAWALLNVNFVQGAKIAALQAAEYPKLIASLAGRNETGGRAYDSLIGASARKGAATTLLTFNRRHFDPAPDGMVVVEPKA